MQCNSSLRNGTLQSRVCLAYSKHNIQSTHSQRLLLRMIELHLRYYITERDFQLLI